MVIYAYFLVASIIGDGEITKIYKNNRRKNHSYREHYGSLQEDYRKWKVSFFNKFLYITPASSSIRLASLPLFTKLYPDFYDEFDTKHLPPKTILAICNLPHFSAISSRKDGQGFILKTTSVKETFNYLQIVHPVTQSCPSMFYKTSWEERLQLEEGKWRSKYPNYTIITSDSERTTPYSNEEINHLLKRWSYNEENFRST